MAKFNKGRRGNTITKGFTLVTLVTLVTMGIRMEPKLKLGARGSRRSFL